MRRRRESFVRGFAKKLDLRISIFPRNQPPSAQIFKQFCSLSAPKSRDVGIFSKAGGAIRIYYANIPIRPKSPQGI